MGCLDDSLVVGEADKVAVVASRRRHHPRENYSYCSEVVYDPTPFEGTCNIPLQNRPFHDDMLIICVVLLKVVSALK